VCEIQCLTVRIHLLDFLRRYPFGILKIKSSLHYMYFMYAFNLATVDCSHSQLCSDHFSHPDSFKKNNLIKFLQPLLNPDSCKQKARSLEQRTGSHYWARSQSSCLSVSLTVCPSVCLIAWNNSAPIGRIAIKFHVSV
jgi:hypothetical protein